MLQKFEHVIIHHKYFLSFFTYEICLVPSQIRTNSSDYNQKK